MMEEIRAEEFVVENDHKADWCLGIIKEEEAERDRLIEIANAKIAELEEQIEDLKQSCENKTSFLKGKLMKYFETVPHKETKTQETYKLLSGSLVMKKQAQKIEKDEARLLEYLKGSHPEFIKTKESIDWAEFKKTLTVEDEDVMNADGEILDCLSVSITPAEFTIK